MVVAMAASGELEAGLAGTGANDVAEEQLPGWPTLYAFQSEAPPYPA